MDLVLSRIAEMWDWFNETIYVPRNSRETVDKFTLELFSMYYVSILTSWTKMFWCGTDY
jgi:hypothetical protein